MVVFRSDATTVYYKYNNNKSNIAVKIKKKNYKSTNKHRDIGGTVVVWW